MVAVLLRAVEILVAAFLMPALTDFGVSNLRFFDWTDAVPAVAIRLRFVPVLFVGFLTLLAASVLTRWSLSFGRGPRIPRQLGAPQRHS